MGSEITPMVAYVSPKAINVCMAIEDGFECHRAADDPSIYYPPPASGFGLVRAKEEGMVDETHMEAYHPKQVSFFWPNPFDTAECEAGTLRGEVTDEDRFAVETLAVMTIRSRGEGAKWLFWRREPEWVSERSFETNTTTHRLQMRGSFVWENTNG